MNRLDSRLPGPCRWKRIHDPEDPACCPTANVGDKAMTLREILETLNKAEEDIYIATSCLNSNHQDKHDLRALGDLFVMGYRTFKKRLHFNAIIEEQETTPTTSPTEQNTKT